VPAAAAAGAAVLAGFAGFEGDANFHTHTYALAGQAAEIYAIRTHMQSHKKSCQKGKEFAGF